MDDRDFTEQTVVCVPIRPSHSCRAKFPDHCLFWVAQPGPASVSGKPYPERGGDNINGERNIRRRESVLSPFHPFPDESETKQTNLNRRIGGGAPSTKRRAVQMESNDAKRVRSLQRRSQYLLTTRPHFSRFKRNTRRQQRQDSHSQRLRRRRGWFLLSLSFFGGSEPRRRSRCRPPAGSQTGDEQ